ncbi:Dps family protein [Hymenobacter nivis]|uniref:DNA starvation/stationary phase protection protein n=1 Tax=Hymenobacter nivis TaxID=1850093 RepID=A0A502GYQ3_9BACT|nr:DNA starvation/stationary phase protection protein [Hymenobacter nivis]TPG66458.1 DNA starvation/stationary phase protection protein [Hymenobacter nivis]
MAVPAKTKDAAPKKAAKNVTTSVAVANLPNKAVNVQPVLNQQINAPAPTQKFGTVSQRLPIGLADNVRLESVQMLNQLLVDTMSLRDLYKKSHWQVTGPTFYQLHLLFDKHYEEQSELVDTIAERIQILGGVAFAMAADVAENTLIPRPPRDREEAPVQISRLLEAHQIILQECHEIAKKADESGDDGTNDLAVSDVMRANELQVWFVSEHVVDSPLVHAK